MSHNPKSPANDKSMGVYSKYISTFTRGQALTENKEEKTPLNEMFHDVRGAAEYYGFHRIHEGKHHDTYSHEDGHTLVHHKPKVQGLGDGLVHLVHAKGHHASTLAAPHKVVHMLESHGLEVE